MSKEIGSDSKFHITVRAGADSNEFLRPVKAAIGQPTEDGKGWVSDSARQGVYANICYWAAHRDPHIKPDDFLAWLEDEDHGGGGIKEANRRAKISGVLPGREDESDYETAAEFLRKSWRKNFTGSLKLDLAAAGLSEGVVLLGADVGPDGIVHMIGPVSTDQGRVKQTIEAAYNRVKPLAVTSNHLLDGIQLIGKAIGNSVAKMDISPARGVDIVIAGVGDDGLTFGSIRSEHCSPKFFAADGGAPTGRVKAAFDVDELELLKKISKAMGEHDDKIVSRSNRLSILACPKSGSVDEAVVERNIDKDHGTGSILPPVTENRTDHVYLRLDAVDMIKVPKVSRDAQQGGVSVWLSKEDCCVLIDNAPQSVGPLSVKDGMVSFGNIPDSNATIDVDSARTSKSIKALATFGGGLNITISKHGAYFSAINRDYSWAIFRPEIQNRKTLKTGVIFE